MPDSRPDPGAILLDAQALRGSERAAYLDRACAGDAALRAEIESLLAFDTETPSILEGHGIARAVDALAGTPTRGEGDLSLPGGVPPQLGPYRLLDRLGEGGMGVVYRARQETPIRRDVALKVVRRGLDTERIVARFEMERRTLARFDHPGVARVLDAGATPDGRPYFVMELVEGQPITAFADGERLSIPQRVSLMIAVCEAVRHAHQRGVIHRDLKPSNILVARRDGRPEPKVIDFGIAKAVAGAEPDTEEALLTRAGQFIGTPDYMSPEQAGAVDAVVDTRTDVYALGIVLYELLAGRRPFAFTRGSHDEVQRVLGGTSPERPSTGLRGRRPRLRAGVTPASPEALARVVEARRTTVARLRRDLAGDLDNIALKAIERDPAARYASVEDLARDLDRYLRGLPVEARPASWSYRARKFVGRHAAAVATAAALAALLAAFVLTTLVQSRRIAAERDRAVAAERAAAREAEAARRVSAFMTDVFTVADPNQGAGNTVTARELLDRGARDIAGLADDPELQASLLQTMGNAYKQLGLYDESVRLLEEAVAVRARQGSEDRDARARLLKDAGDALRMADRNAEAEQRLREALAERDALEHAAMAAGPRPPVAERRALSDRGELLNNLSLVLQTSGQYDESERLMREALELRRRARSLLEASPEPGGGAEARAVEDAVANSLTNLAGLLNTRSRYADAEPLLREALTLRRAVHGERHPRVASTLNTLGMVLARMNRLQESEAVLREALGQRRDLLGPQHPLTMDTVGELASTLHDAGDLAAAEPLYRQRLAFEQARRGESLDEAIALNNLATLLEDRGAFAEARPLYQRSLEIRRAVRGPRHPSVANALNNLGRLAYAQGEFAQARALLQEALALRMEALGATHQQTAGSRYNLGRVQHALGDRRAAEASYRDALEVMAAGRPPSPLAMAAVRVALGELLTETGRAAEAEPILREAVEAREAALGAADWRMAEARVAWGAALLALGRRDEGARLVREHAPQVASSERAPRPARARARAGLATLGVQPRVPASDIR